MFEAHLPLEAYRIDRSHADIGDFTGVDAELLRIGVLLNRSLQLRGAGAPDDDISRVRSACFSLVAGVLEERGRRALAREQLIGASGAAMLASLRDVAELAEDAGALRLANSLLVLGYRELGHDAGARELGRVVAQRARTARKAGDAEAAQALYAIVKDMGVQHDDDELRARAEIGFGNLLWHRGNLPGLEHHATAALEYATRAGALDVVGLAHQSLMIVAAGARMFDKAVMHAWAAYETVMGDETKAAEALLNVAQATLDFGEPGIALRAFVGAFARQLPKRSELPALGGAAVAAARVRELAVLERVIARIDALAQGADLEFDALAARADVALALSSLNDPRVDTWRAHTLAAASAAGFHEIVYRMENLAKEFAPPRHQPASPELLVVLADVENTSNPGELQRAF